MGLTVNESLTTLHGIELASYYMSLKGFRVEHVQYGTDMPKKYIVYTTFLMWVSKDATEAFKPSISEKVINLELDEAPNTNVYETLYEEVKKTLTNYVDDL